MTPPLVLAYHALGGLPREQDPSNLMVPVERFRANLARLRKRGYELVDVSTFASKLRATGPPRGTCALSFDDGTLDNLTLLPEILEQHRARATVYVCPGLLGRPNPFISPEAGIRLMTADELRELAAHPLIEIGSHTNLHAELNEASEEEAYQEMRSSREGLEQLLGQPVKSFAYPNCTYSQACPVAAERAGYESAVTCGLRGGMLPFELRRELVDGLDTRLTFELKARLIWRRIYDSPPGRLGRATARPIRHRSGTGG